MKTFSYLKDYWKEIVIVVVTLFINVIGTLLIPRFTADIIDIGVLNGDFEFIIRQGIIMVFLAIMASVFLVISAKYSTLVSVNFAADVRRAIFVKVQGMNIEQFDEFGPSSMITRSTDDVAQIQNLTRMGLRVVMRAPLMFIGAIIMAVTTNPSMTIIFLVFLPLVVLFTFYMGKLITPIMLKMRKNIDNINRFFRERLTGIRIIRAFDREVYEEERFSHVNEEYIDTFKKGEYFGAVFRPAIGFFMNLVIVTILYFGARQIVGGTMDPGQLLAFIQYGTTIMMSFIMFSMIFLQIPRAKASVDRIEEILNTPDLSSSEGGIELGEIEKVEFKNVSFKYPKESHYTLENISFVAHKGQNVSVIGATGSGKTTLANLLVRFYDATDGKILINDIPIEGYDIKSLRNQIGYTEQRASLISGTVVSNVSMGEKALTGGRVDRYNKNAIENSLEIAQADFVLDDRADGIYRGVAQEGANFSGGQKQRISIARAIYKDPSLYLIDDSFSALDYQTEKNLRKELMEKSQGALKITITQRVSAAEDSDLILLLDKGKMVACGKHSELIESSELYREIIKTSEYEGDDNNER